MQTATNILAKSDNITSGGFIARLIEWNRRRAKYRQDRAAFQHLLALDDAMLDDMGVSRGDVVWAAGLPLKQNASLELQKVSALSRSRLQL